MLVPGLPAAEKKIKMVPQGCNASTAPLAETPPRSATTHAVSPRVIAKFSNRKFSRQNKQMMYNVYAHVRKSYTRLSVRSVCRIESELTGVCKQSVFGMKSNALSGILKSASKATSCVNFRYACLNREDHAAAL